MNLLRDPWLKVNRQSGAIESIAPCELTTHYHSDPIISLIAPRPDFKGALMQFLIGLLQTAFADMQSYHWSTWYQTPPSPENLKDKFSLFEQVFTINEQGQSFMQDLALHEAELKPINSLLLEQPGENTIRNNQDHFIKRSQITALCPNCAVTALYTLQLNAPSGGAGHRTSIRGGGPLTTLILKKAVGNELPTLWQNLWLNVRAGKELFKIKENEPLHNIFPWLAPTRTSEAKTGLETTVQDVHPLQMFWAMPRRIRLDFNTKSQGNCDICGAYSEQLLTQYQTKNYGINYTGMWEHPLSPYSQKADGMWLPVHPQPGGIGYKHWLSLTFGLNGEKKPAAVVNDYLYESKRQLSGQQLQIWAFGYDMDNMKARCWYESHLPLMNVLEDHIFELREAVSRLLEAAGLTFNYVRSTLKKANGDLNRLEMAFWQETEKEFYHCLPKIKQAVEKEQDLLAINQQWYSVLNKKAVDLYNRLAMADLIHKAKFHNELKSYLQGKKLRSVLGLPIVAKKEPKNAVRG